MSYYRLRYGNACDRLNDRNFSGKIMHNSLYCIWGVICASIGVVKIEWRKREDAPGIWITTRVMKFVTAMVVQFKPDTEFHKKCCQVCALGLIIALFWALLDLSLSCCVGSQQREMSQGLMAVGTLMSFLSTLLKAAEYFWSWNHLDREAYFKMILKSQYFNTRRLLSQAPVYNIYHQWNIPDNI